MSGVRRESGGKRDYGEPGFLEFPFFFLNTPAAQRVENTMAGMADVRQGISIRDLLVDSAAPVDDGFYLRTSILLV